MRCSDSRRFAAAFVGALFFAFPFVASAASIPILKPTAGLPNIETTKFASLLVIDVPSGKTLFKQEPEKVWTPASLTKLMTTHVFSSTPRNWSARGTITSADEVGGGRLGVVSGSAMTLKDLLYSAIVGSANNAAEALARQSGLGADGFINAMNAEAERMGMSHTVFHDAAGMDATNKTTAYEMANLMRAAESHEEIAQAMTTFTYRFTVASPRVSKAIKNTNGLLYIEPNVWVTGGKTGFLDESRYNLIVTAKPAPQIGTNGGELMVVVFGAPTRDDSVQATAELAKWAWRSFDWNGSNAAFGQNRGLGEKGADILALQKYLNTHGVKVATSGAGSPGRETTLFGSLTQAALARFQDAHASAILTPQGHVKGAGYLDFQTRAFVNGAVEDVVPTQTSPASPTPAPTPAPVSVTYGRDLVLGSRGQDVLTLQRWLNANGYVLATSGVGSPGHETDYFGPLTQAALGTFQRSHGDEIPSIVLLGKFGVNTRAFLNKVGG